MESLEIGIFVGPALYAVFFAFARITALLAAMPLIGMSSVPIPVRVALGGLTAVVLAPQFANSADLSDLDGLQFGLRLGNEILLGLALGFAIQVVLSVIDLVGTFIGLNAGLGMATHFDPIQQGQANIVTKLIQTAGFLAFFSLNMHHEVFLGLADSFVVAPPGSGVVAVVAGPGMSETLGRLLVDATRISFPVIGIVLVMNLTSALVTRFAQQMNIYFSVGLPLNAVAGLMALGLAVPALIGVVSAESGSIRHLLINLVG